MQDQLAKYRGWQCDGNTPAIELLTKYQFLIKDSNKGEMDPFPNKIMVQAPNKGKKR